MKRHCNQCLKEIIDEHIRVWEEKRLISRMLTFCNKYCMIEYYQKDEILGENQE